MSNQALLSIACFEDFYVFYLPNEHVVWWKLSIVIIHNFSEHYKVTKHNLAGCIQSCKFNVFIMIS